MTKCCKNCNRCQLYYPKCLRRSQPLTPAPSSIYSPRSDNITFPIYLKTDLTLFGFLANTLKMVARLLFQSNIEFIGLCQNILTSTYDDNPSYLSLLDTAENGTYVINQRAPENNIERTALENTTLQGHGNILLKPIDHIKVVAQF